MSTPRIEKAQQHLKKAEELRKNPKNPDDLIYAILHYQRAAKYGQVDINHHLTAGFKYLANAFEYHADPKRLELDKITKIIAALDYYLDPAKKNTAKLYQTDLNLLHHGLTKLSHYFQKENKPDYAAFCDKRIAWAENLAVTASKAKKVKFAGIDKEGNVKPTEVKMRQLYEGEKAEADALAVDRVLQQLQNDEKEHKKEPAEIKHPNKLNFFNKEGKEDIELQSVGRKKGLPPRQRSFVVERDPNPKSRPRKS